MCRYADNLQVQKQQEQFQTQEETNEHVNQNLQEHQVQQDWAAMDYQVKYGRAADLKLPPDYKSPTLNENSKILHQTQLSRYAPDLADLQLASEKRRDAITHMHQSVIGNFLRKKKLPGRITRLLKDMRHYLSDANDAVRMEDQGDVQEPGLWMKIKGLFSAGRWFKNQKKREQIKSIKKRIKELSSKLSNQEKADYAPITKFLMDFDERTSQGNLKDIPRDKEVDTTKNTFYCTDKEEKDENGNPMERQITFQDRREDPLFEQEPSLRDIMQGGLGDCYFLAALASVVSKDPEYIRDMMYDDGQGNVTVRFFRREQDGDTVKSYNNPVYIKVSKQVPKDFASYALWTQIMEKAYTVFRTLYGEKGDQNKQLDPNARLDYQKAAGGHSNLAFEHIYGEKTSTWNADKTTSTSHKEINRIGTFLNKIVMEKDGENEDMKRYAGASDSIRTHRKKVLEPLRTTKRKEILGNLGDADVKEYLAKLLEFEKEQEALNQISNGGGKVDNAKISEAMTKAMAKQMEMQTALQNAKAKIEAIEQLPEYVTEMQKIDQMEKDFKKSVTPPEGTGLAVDLEGKVVLTDEETLRNVVNLAKNKGVAGDLDVIRDKAAHYMNSTIRLCAIKLNREWVNDVEVSMEEKRADGKTYMRKERQTEKLATIEDHVQTLLEVKADIEANGVGGYLTDFFDQVKFEDADKDAVADMIKTGAIRLIDRYIQDADKQTVLHHAPMSGNYTDTAEKRYEEIEAAVKLGPVAAATMQNAKGADATGRNMESVHEGIVDTHAYTVLGVKEIDGKKFIKCQNPWSAGNVQIGEVTDAQGKQQFHFDRTDEFENGIGLVELNHFLQRFDTIYYSGQARPAN